MQALASICKVTGSVFSVLAAITTLTAAFYVLNAFLFSPTSLYVSYAIVWGGIAFVLYLTAGLSFKLMPDVTS